MELLEKHKIAKMEYNVLKAIKDVKKTCEMRDYSVHEFFMYL